MGLFQSIKNLLIYTPNNNQRFELLEDEEQDKQESIKEEIKNAHSVGQQENSNNQNPQKDGNGDIPKQDSTGSNTSGDESSSRTNSNPQQKNSNNNQNNDESKPISKNLADNLKDIKEIFYVPLNQDVVIREFKVLQKKSAFIIYIDGMADKNIINNFLLRQTMSDQNKGVVTEDITTQYIMDNLLSVNQVTLHNLFYDAQKQVLNGLTALFIDGCSDCIVIESRGYETRQVSTPQTETVIRGSQEAFVESIRTNLTLIRRIIKNENLVTEMIPLGEMGNEICALIYMKNLANEKIVDEARRRIKGLNIDFIPGDGYLTQLIEDHPYSLFPQALSTERPDRTASMLMEGKVAIISDGTPYASIAPITFFHLLHTSEDMNLRWHYATVLRGVRLLAAFIAVFLPGLYIALTLYHQEMIPTELLSSLHVAREVLPFPTILEILLMEVSFEIIREAGVRVPGVIGQTLGIIGAIVLGEAAVSAGLVSPVLIIIVAITGLGDFSVSNFSLAFAFRISRFIFLILGAAAGFYGIALGITVFGTYMCSMKSLGVPFFSPVAPKTKSVPDLIVRGPIWTLKRRPDFLNPKNRKRTSGKVREWVSRTAKESNDE